MTTKPIPFLLLLIACGAPADDDPTTSDGTSTDDPTTMTAASMTEPVTDTADSTGTDPTGTPANCGDPNEAAPIYEPPGECYNNAGCATCNCLTFRDTPPLAEAVCAEPGAAGTMRVTATVLEFPTAVVVPSVDVEVFNAFDVGLMGIDNAVAVATTTADAMGRLDLEIMPDDQIGMVAIIRADAFRATATGLAKPPYEPANAIHDIFVIPESVITEYNTALTGDAELADYLPLGDAGGVVGTARNRYTGEPMAGIRLVSLTNGDSTTAIIRYLNEDGSFGTDATSATGTYVLFNPALAEEFEADLDGTIVSTRANKAGSGAPGVFTMNLSIDVDPGSNPFE
jgi:hypothetical protein